MKPAVAPFQVSEDRVFGLTFKHEAFGCVVVSKWTSNVAHRLFGSDLGHRTGVSLTFRAADHMRGLSNDRHSAREILLKVDMSESQWARFVSSQGIGSGVPVTIDAMRTGPYHECSAIAAPELSKKELHGEELRQGVRKAVAAMREHVERLGEMVEEGRIGKNELRRIHFDLKNIVGNLPANVQFVHDQFAEAAENIVEDAKTEIEAHVMTVATQTGLEHLRSLAPTMQLPNERKDG